MIGGEFGAIVWGIIWAQWLIVPSPLDSGQNELSNRMRKSQNELMDKKLEPAEFFPLQTKKQKENL